MLGYHGSTSFEEFERMTPEDSGRLAAQLARLHRTEVELRVTLAKFSAGARLGAGGGEEVR